MVLLEVVDQFGVPLLGSPAAERLPDDGAPALPDRSPRRRRHGAVENVLELYHRPDGLTRRAGSDHLGNLAEDIGPHFGEHLSVISDPGAEGGFGGSDGSGKVCW